MSNNEAYALMALFIMIVNSLTFIFFIRKPSKPIRITLDNKEFRSLIRGGEVIFRGDTNVHLILSDIGYQEMYDMVMMAAGSGNTSKEESIEVNQ